MNRQYLRPVRARWDYLNLCNILFSTLDAAETATLRHIFSDAAYYLIKSGNEENVSLAKAKVNSSLVDDSFHALPSRCRVSGQLRPPTNTNLIERFEWAVGLVCIRSLCTGMSLLGSSQCDSDLFRGGEQSLPGFCSYVLWSSSR